MFEFPFIKRSRIEGEITRGRMDERQKAEKQFNSDLADALQKQRDIYEIKLQEKISEIKTLERVIEDKEQSVRKAHKREAEAKAMVMKAKELVSHCDYAYREHIENGARIMTWFKEMRAEIEVFSKRMIEE